MNRRLSAIAVFASAFVFAAVPARAAGWDPFTSTIGEFLYQPIAGTVKVPWTDPCPSYAEWATRSEKEKVQRMAQYAKYGYLENGTSIEGAYRISNSPDLGANGAGMETRTVSDYLGTSGSVDFEVTADGVIMLPGATGFQAVLMRDQATGRLTLVFRGSEAKVSQIGDWGTDALQALGADTRQYEAAADLLKRILANTTEPIDVVGHSLGGGLTQYAMGMNDLQGRVRGYTYNSAGLSDDTIAKMSQSGIADAGSALVNVRVAGDPVSFFESHIGNIFDVENTGGGNAHSIDTMIESLGNVPDTNGPGLAYAPKAKGSNALASSLDFLGDALDSFLPSEISGPLKSLLDQYIRAELLKAAGMLDAKALEKLAELKAKLDKMLPDDASRAAVNKMVGDVVSGNWENLPESAKEAAFAISDHYILEGLDKLELGLGKAEKEAILKAYHDAVNAWMNGGDVGETITGNLESYIYDKIKSEVGEKAADSWKGVWTDLTTGTDPWADFGTATLDTIEFIGMRELQQGLDKYFNELVAKNPALADFLGKCGINTQSLMTLANDIWGVVRGDGSPMQKLEDICEKTADYLWDCFGKLVESLVDEAFKVAMEIVNWLCVKAHEIIEKLDQIIEEWLDKGFDPDFSSLMNYVNAVAAQEDEKAILVTDFAADGTVQFEGGRDVQPVKTEEVHNEAF